MGLSEHPAILRSMRYAVLMAGICIVAAQNLRAEQPAEAAGEGQMSSASGQSISHDATDCEPSQTGSAYIPVDSWVYPALWRLYALGFVDTVYLGMRPYTRASIDHMLEETATRVQEANPGPEADEAEAIYESLKHELYFETQGSCDDHKANTRVESVYSVERAIGGTPLRDSFHLGSTIINDYGRPYEKGFNDYTGASGYASAGRYQLYVRGEFQGAPSGAGYSTPLAQTLAAQVDATNYFFNPTCYLTNLPPACVPVPLNQLATIPAGPIVSQTNLRIMEAYASVNYLNHEISFGKQDDWLGPGLGAGMAYSNNAENIYSFRINRIEPLRIPWLSYITGPFRYEFLVGSLKGHIYPNDPWVHVEKVSFRPTENLEFGFERSAIWGGKLHEPITLHTFLRSFFSLSAAPGPSVKDSPQDPGARFGSFDFSYRLPLLRRWLTFYTDSEAHDEVSPADAPRRSSYRPGIYLSHVPWIPKLDLRAEAANTDPSTTDSRGGHFEYWETLQRQGYTNKGVLFGDWIGREDKGGQGWATYHLSGNEWLQVGVRTQKATKDFIPGGTTLSDVTFQAVKRLRKDIEINGTFAYERWKAPIYPSGTPTYPASQQSVATTTIQITWFPKNKLHF
jgi:hypothetical protein